MRDDSRRSSQHEAVLRLPREVWARKSDTAIAHASGVPRSTITHYRQTLGMPHANRARLPVGFWDGVDFTRGDAVLAAELGVPERKVQTARQRRGIHKADDRNTLPIDWDAQPLGQAPDRVLADELGCCVSTVAKHRNLRGITAFGWRQ